MADRKFKVGDRVYYDGEIWIINWISENNRMANLTHEESGRFQIMVYLSDLS